MTETEFFSVKNLSTYQHYKHRNPPWIKLHRTVLTDFLLLQQAPDVRFVHILLCVLASEDENRIPLNYAYLSTRLGFPVTADHLTPLFHSGLLLALRKHSASKMLASCKQDASKMLAKCSLRDRVETETETERETEGETETETEERREKIPGGSSERPGARMRAVPQVTQSGEVWTAYAHAYQARYGVLPIRNASVNAQLCQLVKRLGFEAAPVAAYYVSHNGNWYVTKMHPVPLLVVDAEKLRTEWATGRRMTTVEARSAEQVDALQSQVDRVGRQLQEVTG